MEIFSGLQNQADSKTESLCCNVVRRKSLCIGAEKPKTQNAHDALVVQGTLLVFLVACSTHLWCAPDALGQALFSPWHGAAAAGSPGMPWVQCAMHYDRHTRAACSSAPLACDWYATGVWGATSGLSLSTISGGTTQGGPGGRVDGDRQRGKARGERGGETHFPDLRLPAQPTTDLRPRPKPNRWVAGI